MRNPLDARSAPRLAIIQAPSVLGLRPSGVQDLPTTLLGYGLAERLHARHAATLETPVYSDLRDTETRTLNAASIASWSPRLADAVEAVLDANEFPLVLGGDCSILLGTMLAFRRRGRYGLLFVDGHADFYQVEVNPNGEAASMELAFATGRGPARLADIEGRGPLVRDDDVTVFGHRDAAEQAEYGSQPLPAAMAIFDLPTIRRIGIAAATAGALAQLQRAELEGFFIHVDADCLADEVMPAVDYRMPGGLALDELRHLLREALRTGRAVGLELTIYNPRLDRDGSAGRALADLMVDVFRAGNRL